MFDNWIKQCIALWNLLLGIELGLYCGQTKRSHGHINWRPLLKLLNEEEKEAAEDRWLNGKRTKKDLKNETWSYPPGSVVAGAIEKAGWTDEFNEETAKQLVSELSAYPGWFDKSVGPIQGDLARLHKAVLAAAKSPKPLDPRVLAAIGWKFQPNGAPIDEHLAFKLFGKIGYELKNGAEGDDFAILNSFMTHRKYSQEKKESITEWLLGLGANNDKEVIEIALPKFREVLKDTQPRIFIRGQLLMKFMARLKKLPHTEWIAELPSHAAQAVCDDLDKAIAAVFREHGKRQKGEKAQKRGMPRFKRSKDTSASVYFANVQMSFDKNLHPDGTSHSYSKNWRERGLVTFAADVGQMPARIPDFVSYGLLGEGAMPKLMGGCVWKQAGKWFLSCQWQINDFKRLPESTRVAAIKIGASIPITMCDAAGTHEYTMPPLQKDTLRTHKLAGQHLARAVVARRTRADKLAARKKWQDERRGIDRKRGNPKIKPSRKFQRASIRLSGLEMRDKNIRNDWIHRITTSIVRRYGIICTQPMEVAKMMNKDSSNSLDKKDELTTKGQGRSTMKAARRMMRRAAMSTIEMTLAYKMRELRGECSHKRLPSEKAVTQTCEKCGAIHPEMKRGKPILRCDNILENGTVCGTVLLRNRNAARVMYKELLTIIKEEADENGRVDQR